MKMPETTGSVPTRIMVGLDGSTGSERALGWAINVAKRTGAEILAVHAFQPYSSGFSGFEAVAIPEGWTAELKRLLENEWTAPLRAAGVPYRTIFEEGAPAPTMIAIAASEHADLIVTGNRGLGGFRELLLGSVSQQLVLYAQVPVVIIPAERKDSVETPSARAVAAP